MRQAMNVRSRFGDRRAVRASGPHASGSPAMAPLDAVVVVAAVRPVTVEAAVARAVQFCVEAAVPPDLAGGAEPAA